MKAKSLVAQALTNTNSNIFNVSLSLVTTRCKWEEIWKCLSASLRKIRKQKCSQIVGVGDNGPPCAHQQQKPVKIQPKIPLVPPRPPTIIGGPLPCLGDERGPSANSGSLRFLDLGDAGGPCREPYGPLGAPMASQLVRYLQFFPARSFGDHKWNWASMTMDDW